MVIIVYCEHSAGVAQLDPNPFTNKSSRHRTKFVPVIHERLVTRLFFVYSLYLLGFVE